MTDPVDNEKHAEEEDVDTAETDSAAEVRGTDADDNTAAEAHRPARLFGVRRSFLILGLVLVVAAVSTKLVMDHYWRMSFADTYPRPAWIPEKDAPYVPTPQELVDRMLELAEVSEDDLLYDLGCGDGRIVVSAAKQYGCRAVGFDNNPVRIAESWQNADEAKVESLVRFSEENIFDLDLSEASVITIYLLPRLNVRLIPQLEKLKPGSRIVSHMFDMKGVTPDEVITLTCQEDQREHKLYLWTTPLKKE